MRRTTSFGVLSVKIGLMDSPVGELINQKSAVNFEQEGCIFHLYGEQKLLGVRPQGSTVTTPLFARGGNLCFRTDTYSADDQIIMVYNLS